jgi:hypothetical protein
MSLSATTSTKDLIQFLSTARAERRPLSFRDTQAAVQLIEGKQNLGDERLAHTPPPV